MTDLDLEHHLEARDLGHVKPLLPLLSWLVHHYFRANVAGWDNVPDGPVIFVGNHSGGAGSPDSAVFILSFLDHFGIDRPLYWLAHELLMQVPVVNDLLTRFGVVTASRGAANAILEHGGSLIVYPGGERELHRPFAERNQVQLHGRTGFLELARDSGVPIVPVVAHGGHHTYLPLTDGRRVARALRLDRLLNLKTLPVSLVAPWGVDVGGFLPHLPLPAKIRIRLLEPINVAEEFDGQLGRAYAHVTRTMQATLDELAAP